METDEERRRRPADLAIRIGVVGAIGVGAVLSGLFVSRRGRHLLKEVWQGKRRSRLEDRVLDTLWGDPVLGRRPIEVREESDGKIVLSGRVRTLAERRLAVREASRVNGVREVVVELSLDRRLARPPAYLRRRMRDVRS